MSRPKQRHLLAKLTRTKLLFGAGFVAVWLLLLGLHGLLPGMTGALPVKYSDLGSIQCGAESMRALLHARCATIGGPGGGIIPVGLPYVFVGAVLLKLLPISLMAAYFILTAGIMAVALAGVYRLVRLLNIAPAIALTAGGLYLALPLTLSMSQFGGTYWGFLLLPAALYLAWWLLQQLERLTPRRVALVAGVWLLLSLFMIFGDGYSFFMYVLGSGLMLAVWGWGRWRQSSLWLAAGLFVAANAVAYLTYRRLLPGSSQWSDSINLFRAMGLDIVTLFRPVGNLWWVKLLGLHFNSGQFWGDGSNSSSNYIGLIMLGLAAFGIYKLRRQLSRLAVALLLIGLAAFVLSLGPSLKVNATRPSQTTGPVARSSYFMPSSAALVTLPTQPLYRGVPGLRAMRATYRWHILTLLVLLIFAAAGVQWLVDHKRAKWGYFLLGLMCLELLPNPLTVMRVHSHVNHEFTALNQNVVTPLKRYIRPGEKIIYYPNAVGNNDFLVNYITPQLGASTYNIGGDKAELYAYKYMPAEALALLYADDNPVTLQAKSDAYLRQVLDAKLVEAVVVPKFDLRWDAYSWPPNLVTTGPRAAGIIQLIQADPSLHIQAERYFYIVTLRP